MNRICFRFTCGEPLKYISHLDLMRLLQRAFRRSALPVAYSQGFNPHLRFNLAVPLPVGVTAEEEYGEVFLTEDIQPEEFMMHLREQLPAGVELTGAFSVDEQVPPLPSLVSAALYRATLITNPDAKEAPAPNYISQIGQSALKSLMKKDEILAPRSSKKNKKKTYVNVRPYIIDVKLKNLDGYHPLDLDLLLQAGSQGGVSPAFVLEQLDLELGDNHLQTVYWELHRVRLYRDVDGSLQPLFEGK